MKTGHTKTVDEAATQCGVSRRTFIDWTKRAGFPSKTQRGWPLKKIDAWLRHNSLGQYRNQSSPQNLMNAHGLTLTEARRLKTIEQAEIARLEKVQRQIELERVRGNILLTDDVERFHSRLAFTIVTLIEQMPDAVDRELPTEAPSKKTWPSTRARVIRAIERIGRDVVATARDFCSNRNDETDTR